ncbi:YggS family pyridoxal phosphate-dependent enzyme [bacterium]|nr:YggS family pyridoxal phosphate-dependent enzyme [bacterium]
MKIRERVQKIVQEIPENVKLVAATKTRTIEEIKEVIDAGVEILGENYVQEAEGKILEIGKAIQWHMVGHLQTNKADKAVDIFDMVETVDSIRLANRLNRTASEKKIVYPVLIEINSGKEEKKAGVFPEEAESLIRNISKLSHIRIEGLMTMGPFLEKVEEIKPFFRLTKEIFDYIKSISIPNVEMKYLSMGMSDTWRIAIEEGANLIRLGTVIFGPRKI